LRGWHNNRLTWEPVGQNRREAQRALDARRGDIARRTYKVLQDKTFEQWSGEWIASASVKPASRRTYGFTLAYATKTFGKTKLRDLGPDDIRRFLDVIREANLERHKPKTDDEPAREVSAATLAKHLRQLGACLEAAVAEGYATENAVRKLHKTAKPKVAKSKPAYFTNAELSALWLALAATQPDRPVLLALCRAACLTGAREGELVGLRWSDIDLLNREVHIARTVVADIGEQTPKSGEPRTLDLSPQAAQHFEDWYANPLRVGDDLVFSREDGKHFTPHQILRALYAAMEHAGIPRVGERGRERNFHSLRHSFARLTLENSAPIDWLRRQLGHSNIALTVQTYGEWSREAQKKEAAKLDGVFPV
jgi:integrase